MSEHDPPEYRVSRTPHITMKPLKMKENGVAATVACLGLALIAASVPVPARADCGEELRLLREKLADVKDAAQRSEIQKLAEKAEKDQKQGRVRLCEAAVARAQTLLK